MIFSTWKKYETTVSYILTFVFVLSSIILLNHYSHVLNELSEQHPVTYAQNGEVAGISEPQESIIPTEKSKKEPTITPSPTPIPISPSPQKTPAAATIISSPEISPTQAPPASTQTNTSNSYSEILQALNNYRNSKGIESLAIDEKLQSFAQGRAEHFASTGSMDSHAGFQNMLSDNGFEKMGFDALGENSSYGAWESPKFLIENFYGNSPAHNESQLRSDWTHVGIGVKDNATNLVFGGKKR